jgi:hypothetical protein
VRIVGYGALLLVAAFGVYVVRRLVRSWRDTYAGARGAGGDADPR